MWFPKCGLCTPHFEYASTYMWYSKFAREWYLFKAFNEMCNINGRKIESVHITYTGNRTEENALLCFKHKKIEHSFWFPVNGLRRTIDENKVKFKNQYWQNLGISIIIKFLTTRN